MSENSLTPFDRAQLRIAQESLKQSPFFANLMGMSHVEAAMVLQRLSKGSQQEELRDGKKEELDLGGQVQP